MNGLIRCYGCGKLVARGSMEMEFVDGHFVCADCLDEFTFVCERCGERHLKEFAVEVYDRYDECANWCTNCADEHAFECDHCGKLYDADDVESTDVNGETWCEDCRDDDAVMCYECGDWFPYDECVEVDGDYYCEDCRDEYLFLCDNCEEWHRVDDRIVTREGSSVCEDCINCGDYYYCEECGEYVTGENWDDEADMCFFCARARATSSNAVVRSYHSAPPLRWIGRALPTWNGVMRGVGVELEVDCDYRNDKLQDTLNRIDALAGDELHFEHDGSLNHGFEIVTQPHTVEAFYEMPWEEILQICLDNNFSSHDVGTCGLHMHFSREMFGADKETQDDCIAKLMQFYELYWDEILKVSRRTQEQADSWASRYGTIGKTNLKKIVKGEGGYGTRSRYKAINNCNTHTVEIRLTRGTLNKKSFYACCDFMITAVNNSCRIGWSDTTDSIEWLRGIKPETIEYLRNVHAFTDVLDTLSNNN